MGIIKTLILSLILTSSTITLASRGEQSNKKKTASINRKAKQQVKKEKQKRKKLERAAATQKAADQKKADERDRFARDINLIKRINALIENESLTGVEAAIRKITFFKTNIKKISEYPISASMYGNTYFQYANLLPDSTPEENYLQSYRILQHSDFFGKDQLAKIVQFGIHGKKPNPKEAKEIYIKALREGEKNLGENTKDNHDILLIDVLGSLHNNLALLYQTEGKQEKALEHFKIASLHGNESAKFSYQGLLRTSAASFYDAEKAKNPQLFTIDLSTLTGQGIFWDKEITDYTLMLHEKKISDSELRNRQANKTRDFQGFLNNFCPKPDTLEYKIEVANDLSHILTLSTSAIAFSWITEEQYNEIKEMYYNVEALISPINRYITFFDFSLRELHNLHDFSGVLTQLKELLKSTQERIVLFEKDKNLNSAIALEKELKEKVISIYAPKLKLFKNLFDKLYSAQSAIIIMGHFRSEDNQKNLNYILPLLENFEDLIHALIGNEFFDSEENDSEENDSEENDSEENDSEENDSEENDSEENDLNVDTKPKLTSIPNIENLESKDKTFETDPNLNPKGPNSIALKKTKKSQKKPRLKERKKNSAIQKAQQRKVFATSIMKTFDISGGGPGKDHEPLKLVYKFKEGPDGDRVRVAFENLRANSDRFREILKAIEICPWGLQGIGKAEVLRYKYKNVKACFSRRITNSDRFTYAACGKNEILVIGVGDHYSKKQSR